MLYLAGRWADRNLSRLELAMAVIVLGLILWVLLVQMLRVFAMAERSLLSSTVINVTTGLQYRAAGYTLRNDHAALGGLLAGNPFEAAGSVPDDLPGAESPRQILSVTWRAALPGRYLGELEGPDPADIPGGNWYYDRSDRTLVYRVDNDEFFVTGLPGPARVKFAVVPEYEDLNGNGRFDPGIDNYQSIRLQAVNDYEWRL